MFSLFKALASSRHRFERGSEGGHGVVNIAFGYDACFAGKIGDAIVLLAYS